MADSIVGRRPQRDFIALKRGIRSAIVIGVVLFAVTVAVERTNPAAEPAVAMKGVLNSVKAKQLDLVVDMAKLFINWSFAIIGANAYFLKQAAESKVSLRPSELALFEIAVASALISVLFGQVAIGNVVALLELDQFSAASPKIDRYVTWQYWSLIASVIFTVASSHIFFWTRHEISDR